MSKSTHQPNSLGENLGSGPPRILARHQQDCERSLVSELVTINLYLPLASWVGGEEPTYTWICSPLAVLHVSVDGKHDFTAPKTNKCPLKWKHFKRKIIFQLSFFKGDRLVFREGIAKCLFKKTGWKSSNPIAQTPKAMFVSLSLHKVPACPRQVSEILAVRSPKLA